MSSPSENDTIKLARDARRLLAPRSTVSYTDAGIRFALQALNIPTTAARLLEDIRKAEHACARGLRNLHLFYMTAPREGWSPASPSQRSRYMSKFYGAGERVERACSKVLAALTLNRVLSKPTWTAKEEAQMLQSVQRMIFVVYKWMENLLQQQARDFRDQEIEESDGQTRKEVSGSCGVHSEMHTQRSKQDMNSYHHFKSGKVGAPRPIPRLPSLSEFLAPASKDFPDT